MNRYEVNSMHFLVQANLQTTAFSKWWLIQRNKWVPNSIEV